MNVPFSNRTFKTAFILQESEKSDVGTDEEFDDGLDEDLVGDDDDRKKLAGMTEREREEELFKRAEKREEARKRFVRLNIRFASSHVFPRSRILHFLYRLSYLVVHRRFS